MKDLRRRGTRRTTAVVGVSAGALLLTSLVAWAGHDATTVHACADRKTGLLRLVADPGQCTDKEFATDWARQGPAGADGAPGAPGPAGADGATGAPGPAGVSGYERVTETVDVSGLPRRQHVVECPPGKKVLGGGATIQGGGTLGRIALRESLPLGESAWIATASTIPEQDADFSLTVTVICADVG